MVKSFKHNPVRENYTKLIKNTILFLRYTFNVHRKNYRCSSPLKLYAHCQFPRLRRSYRRTDVFIAPQSIFTNDIKLYGAYFIPFEIYLLPPR